VIRIGSVGTEDGGVCDIGDLVDAADERDRGCGTAFAGAGIPGMWGAEEVLVVPEGLCGDCWSRKAIAAWRVMPMSFEGLRIGNRNKKQRRWRK
jgi:hypothetical protein